MEINYLETEDHFRLRTAIFHPENPATAVVQMIHGFSEGIEHYQKMATFFTSNDIIFVIHDQRGFGIEAKNKGINDGYDKMLSDITEVRQMIAKRFPMLPVILYGFSMGGNLALNYLLENGEKSYQKIILESPWLRLYQEPSNLTKNLAKFLGNFNHHFSVKTHINPNLVLHDENIIKSVKNDGMITEKIGLKLFSEMVQNGQKALNHAAKISLPVLLFAAEKDKIVSPQAIQEFAEKSNKNVTFVTIKNAYHCLHYDDCETEILQRIKEFIKNE